MNSASGAFRSQPARSVLRLALTFNTLLIPGFAQSNSVWTGSASRTATVSGSYTEQGGGSFYYKETQTWRMTGQAPTQQSGYLSFPAIWEVTGHGTKTPITGTAQSYDTTWSVPRPLDVRQLMNPTRWKITAEQTSQALGTTISGYSMPFAITELTLPDNSSPSIPLDNPSQQFIAPNIIVAQQPGSGVGSTVAVTPMTCHWHFGPPDPGSRFVPLQPCRVVDTRSTTFKRIRGFLYPSVPVSFPLAGQCGLPPVTSPVRAYSLNVTAVPFIGPV